MELHLKLKQDITTALKTLFSFSKYSETVFFPKKLHRNMIFFALSGKMVILFSKNILFFRRKMKDDLSRKCDIFCGCSEKMVFPKNRIGIWSFLYYQKKTIFLFPEKIILLFRRKMKHSLSKKLALDYDLSSIIRKDDISISQNYDLSHSLSLHLELICSNLLTSLKIKFSPNQICTGTCSSNVDDSIKTPPTRAIKNIIRI